MIEFFANIAFCRKLFSHNVASSIFHRVLNAHLFKPLSANPKKQSNTLKQRFCKRIVRACLTILLGWRLKGQHMGNHQLI